MEETRGEFFPLEELLTFKVKHRPAVMDTFKYPDLSPLPDLLKELESLGLRSFSFLGQGQHSLAFYTTEGQVVRLSLKNEPARIQHPAILQPIYSKTIGHGLGCKLEVLPFVRTEGVTDEHVAMVQKALEASGYSVFDIANKGNVGLIRSADGKTWVPVLIDHGALQLIPDRKQHHEIEAILAPWQGAQEGYDSRILSEKVTNTVPGKQLSRLEKTLTGDGERESMLVKALKGGLYLSELEKFSEKAARETTAKGKKDWRKRLEDKIEDFDKSTRTFDPPGKSGKGRK
jgi:hypothetical protein